MSASEARPRLLPHQLTRLTARQAVQGQAGLVGDRRPGRLELGAEGQHGEDSVVQPLGDELLQEFQRRGIHPVQVLDNEQNRPLHGAHPQPLDHRPEGLFALPGWGQRKRREAVRGW